jgi:hypothetical protein
MTTMTRKNFLIPAALAVVVAVAHAEFVDERTAVPDLAGSRAVTEVVATAAPAAPAPPRFDVTADDRSVREVLARWARGANWTHQPQHWTLDKDHPIQGTAAPDVFGPEFKTAVRRLLSSTELTDRPVQPCFYVNNVVRVIPKSELCDRTQQ